MEGVVNIVDDIIVVGWGEFLVDVIKDYDCIVFNLLVCFFEYNFKFNLDKI